MDKISNEILCALLSTAYFCEVLPIHNKRTISITDLGNLLDLFALSRAFNLSKKHNPGTQLKALKASTIYI